MFNVKSNATGTENIIIFLKIFLLKKNKKNKMKGIIKIMSLTVLEMLIKKLRKIEKKLNNKSPKNPNSKIFCSGSIFLFRKK